jgi:hypothetical protein
MNDEGQGISWPGLALTALLMFLVVGVSCVLAFTVWMRDLAAPRVAILGSGNQLSLLVTDGPARLLLATGDDPIQYENALTRVRPIFARRIDVLLMAGSGESLLVPLAAEADAHVRMSMAIAPLPPSAEASAIGPVAAFTAPRRITLGPSVAVTIETALPFGADEEETFPSWRATIEHGETRVVVLSDGDAAALFPPDSPASVLVVSGAAAASAWGNSPAAAIVANGAVVSGSALREALGASPRPPRWAFLVHSGEALRLTFIEGGIEIPSEFAQDVAASPGSAVVSEQR